MEAKGKFESEPEITDFSTDFDHNFKFIVKKRVEMKVMARCGCVLAGSVSKITREFWSNSPHRLGGRIYNVWWINNVNESDFNINPPTSTTTQFNNASALKLKESARMNTKGKIIRKLLGQGPATPAESGTDANNVDSPQLRPSASQNTIYAAGAPIACLDRYSNGQRTVIAGPKVFKVLRIDGSKITEEADLRAAITSHATTHDLSSGTSDQLNIRAVRWSYRELESTIITASGNGRITLYDLNRFGEGLEVARIQEHTRQVHKLALSPIKPYLLLSASQDGTVRLHDLRQAGRTTVFKCNADAVRDVKWSPTDGYIFACCTDAGVVQSWDIRKPSAPSLKITAHPSSCFSISYHPDGQHVASGGTDQLCQVWDLSKTADRNQKPKFTFSAPAPISQVCWRPACWSATARGRRAAQVAVSYDDTNSARNQTSNIHIWDLARPTMPFKELEQWDTAPSGLLWNTRDLLWTVDKEGRFIQTDVAFVPKLIDRRSLSTFAFSPTGDLLMLLEERQPQRRPRPPISTPNISPGIKHEPLLSISRSDSEEDVVGSFLGPRQRKSHRRRDSARLTQSLSPTPPNPNGMADASVMSLDSAIKVTGLYKPQQVMAVGHAPSTADRETYKFLSNRYLGKLYDTGQDEAVNVRTKSILEFYAHIAEKVSQYRLAQTWRVLAFTIDVLLTRRAEHHRASRLSSKQAPATDEGAKEEFVQSKSRTERGEETPRPKFHPQSPIASPHYKPVSIAAEEAESTSNVATPLVRPAPDSSIADETREAMETSLVIENDVLNLPESVVPAAPTPIPVPSARRLDEHSSSSMEGYDFYGMDSLHGAIDFASPPRKQPLRLDYSGQANPPRIQPERHDSGESFQMFSTSADSHPGKFMSSSGSDTPSLKDRQTLRDKVSSWENSPDGKQGHRPSIDSNDSTQLELPEEHHFTPNADSYRIGAHPALAAHRPSTPPVFRIQEASVPPNGFATPSKVNNKPLSPNSSERAAQNPEIIESDFLPRPDDPQFVMQPIDPSILVQRVINFESQTGALNAAIMVLLLRPLLPDDAIDDIQAGAILRQYHHRLTGMKLFTEAALLRNLCVPTYPAVFATAQENIKIGFFCTDCHKPLENDPLILDSEWFCSRCEQSIEACAICKSRDVSEAFLSDEADFQANDRIWWICPGCGHGGHSLCVQAWHAGPEFSEGEKNSDGGCPLEGCLHPCLPGKWREQRVQEKNAIRAKELESLVRENSRTGSRGGVGRGGHPVRRDVREVNQSRAVEGVRVALGLNNTSGGLERRKSVKLLAPGEE